jgi:hypothetical protein
MNGRLDIQTFIEQHADWEKLLAEKPYCITITRDEMLGKKLIMFKYSQIDSEFNIKLVRECRGLILNEDTLEPVSVPFFKFGNAGESYCPDIDWKSASILQKVDGSLVKIVLIGDDLLISTNGIIDAFKAPVAKQNGCKYKSFGEIVQEILDKKLIIPHDFVAGKTYMFELVSPWTRVVVPHKQNDLYFLGERDNATFQEKLPWEDKYVASFFKMPEKFGLHSLDECIAATKAMPWDEEGYVVVDKDFNRVKVKSPSYVAVHNLKGNGVLSYSRAIKLVRSNEIDEVCSYFEEFRPALEECKARFWKLVEDSENAWNEYLKVDSGLQTRKDKALWITKNFKIPGLAFGLLDKKISSVRDFFMNSPTDKLLKFLGYKE